MSHFSVVVATAEYPSDEVLNRELQPFHEFECTGTDDQYVQDVDQTDEVRAEYEEAKGDYASLLEFVKECHGKELVAFGETPDLSKPHKHGYALLDANGDIMKVVDRTNPNRKWDYWRVGGRYTGKFQGHGGSQAKPSYEWELGKERPPEGLDICQKCNLDVAQMKKAAVSHRQKWADECAAKSGLGFEDFGKACHELVAGYAEWMKLPEPRPRGADYASWLADTGRHLGSVVQRKCWEVPEPAEGQSLVDWIQAAPWLTSFAFLREGKWAEKGRIGWWACVSNENEDWPTDFQKLIEDVPGEWWLTVVDCHI